MNKIAIIYHPLGEKKFTTLATMEEGKEREYAVVEHIDLTPGGVIISFTDEAGSKEVEHYLNMPIIYNEWSY